MKIYKTEQIRLRLSLDKLWKGAEDIIIHDAFPAGQWKTGAVGFYEFRRISGWSKVFMGTFTGNKPQERCREQDNSFMNW